LLFILHLRFIVIAIREGYGHVTPLSEGGKIFCIVYALIGIPMTLMMLTALVDRLMVPTTWFLRYLNAKLVK